mmetsp:Transcript_5101/g.7380  ORF Transcript_5101/g.7380 Transcript_5101/m.7380 type:complete len:342 (+) Transcript_5101:709-1734(+)
MDIIYGPCTAIGGIKYTLLDSQQIRAEAPPPCHQYQNGLVERRWQSILIMARKWLRNELLPSKFIKTICVGTCTESDSLLFYHPTKKKVLSAADGYRFDPSLQSGPQFNMKYDSDFYLTRKSEMPIHQASIHKLGTSCYVKKGDKYLHATILSVSIEDNDDTYTVQMDNNNIESLHEEDILDHDPNAPVPEEKGSISPIHHWVKHHAKVTIFLIDHWNKPKQGNLHFDEKEKEWYTTEAPTSLLKHNLLSPNDKRILDESYREEYEGLTQCDTYKVITENKYKNLKSIAKGILPTMAIATVKKDGDGNPIQAKYRIVVLGNLDPHPWIKLDCFAPVYHKWR